MWLNIKTVIQSVILRQKAISMLQAIPGRNTKAPGVDMILDLVGASHFSKNIEVLSVEGRMLLVGLPSGVKSEINLAQVRIQSCLACLGTLSMCMTSCAFVVCNYFTAERYIMRGHLHSRSSVEQAQAGKGYTTISQSMQALQNLP